jgi:hypothetical protein
MRQLKNEWSSGSNHHSASYRVCFLNDWDSPEVLSCWKKMLALQETAEAVYQDPKFFRFLASTEQADRIQVAALRDETDAIVGVVPMRFVSTTLNYSIAQFILARSTFGVVSVLGSEPMVPPDDGALLKLFSEFGKKFTNHAGISLPSVETTGTFWRYLTTSEELRRDFFVYIPYGPRRCYSLRLPTTFQEYLTQLTAKKRHNFGRQARMLRELGKGKLELRRIDSLTQLSALHSAIAPLVPSDSNFLRQNTIAALAAEGLLLCYVLMVGDQPCALTLGVKSNSTYRIWRTHFDPSFAKFSPGSTLLHLLIEDLIENCSIQTVDLGYGSPYSKSPSNKASSVRAEVLLLRKTLLNRLRVMCHLGFWSLSDWVKRRGSRLRTGFRTLRLGRNWGAKVLLTLPALLSPGTFDLIMS